MRVLARLVRLLLLLILLLLLLLPTGIGGLLLLLILLLLIPHAAQSSPCLNSFDGRPFQITVKAGCIIGKKQDLRTTDRDMPLDIELGEEAIEEDTDLPRPPHLTEIRLKWGRALPRAWASRS